MSLARFENKLFKYSFQYQASGGATSDTADTTASSQPPTVDITAQEVSISTEQMLSFTIRALAREINVHVQAIHLFISESSFWGRDV